MGYGDWIFLGILIVFAVLGSLMGFGKVLNLFVLNKYVRIAVAVFVCYSFGGLILSIPFVNQTLADISSNWANVAFLNFIHLELVIYYVALFFIVLVLLWVSTKLIRGISEIKLLPIRILNSVGGAVLLSVFVLALILIVFQIIAWIGGNTANNFYATLTQNANGIVRPLFENNPMIVLIRLIKK